MKYLIKAEDRVENYYTLIHNFEKWDLYVPLYTNSGLTINKSSLYETFNNCSDKFIINWLLDDLYHKLEKELMGDIKKRITL